MSYEKMSVISRLAGENEGFLRTRDAVRLGVSSKTVAQMNDARIIEREAQGVYRLVGVPPQLSDPILFAWLASGGERGWTYESSSVVTGGETAAELHGIGDFAPAVHDFLVPRRKASRRRTVHSRIRRTLDARDLTMVRSIPALT